MKSKSLKDKLELYYDKLQNPAKIIGNWSIVDIDAYNNIKKYKIIAINTIVQYDAERIISLETKDKYITIKYNPTFIASKITTNEYNYIIQDWDLIAVDKLYLYKGEIEKVMTNKEIIKLLNIKLSNKAKKDLDYFN